jgi:hypothetical protein
LSVADYQGNFGTNYAAAARIAMNGYQEQSVKQTLYPAYRSQRSTNSFTLPDGGALLVTFSGLSKLQKVKFGFCSPTVCGADQYLVSNALNRFEIGDRTYNLKYDDSTSVYGADADNSTDGPFQILIQPANITPSDNWTSNWLPVLADFSWLCMFVFCFFMKIMLTCLSTLVRPGGFYDKWKLRISYCPEYQCHSQA